MNDFKESIKVPKLFNEEELKYIRENNEAREQYFEENSESYRPMGGKKIANDMSHLVSNERLQEIFDEEVLGKSKIDEEEKEI